MLLLGGGPAVQTLEVAIYAAARLDFDLVTAVKLALIQIAHLLGDHPRQLPPSRRSRPASTAPPTPRWRDAGVARALQWLVLALALLGFAAPLLAVLARWPRRPRRRPRPARVLERRAHQPRRRRRLGAARADPRRCSSPPPAPRPPRALARIAIGAPAYAYLAVPAVALSLGAFLFVRNLGVAPDAAAPLVVVIANALLSLPFVMADAGARPSTPSPAAAAS